MEIISFFGEKLAKKINKAVLPSSGIIRMAIKDSQKEPSLITVEELRAVFSSSLKDYLHKLRIADVDEVSVHMISELDKNQSLLTMIVT